MSILVFTNDGMNLIDTCVDYNQVGKVLNFHSKLVDLLPTLCTGKSTVVGNYLLVRDETDNNHYDSLDSILEDGIVDEPVYIKDELLDDLEDIYDNLYEHDIMVVDKKVDSLNKESRLTDEEHRQLIEKLTSETIEFSIFALDTYNNLIYLDDSVGVKDYADKYFNELFSTETDQIQLYKKLNNGEAPYDADALQATIKTYKEQLDESIFNSIGDAILDDCRWVRAFDRILYLDAYTKETEDDYDYEDENDYENDYEDNGEETDSNERETDTRKIDQIVNNLNSQKPLPKDLVERILDHFYNTDEISFSTYNVTTDGIIALDKQYNCLNDYIQHYLNSAYPHDYDEDEDQGYIEAYRDYYDEEPTKDDIRRFKTHLENETYDYFYSKFQEALGQQKKFVRILDQIVNFNGDC